MRAAARATVHSDCTATDGDLGVAVCLVGFVRTLGRRYVYESIDSHFRGHAATSVDFFGVVSSTGTDTAKGQWGDARPDALSAALRVLRPVAWADVRDTQGPRCGLLCMRQFDRMLQCGDMVEAREKQCKGRYSWVVKARPDVTITGGKGVTLEHLGMHSDRDVVYKDRRVMSAPY
jgi:hypothetical protein